MTSQQKFSKKIVTFFLLFITENFDEKDSSNEKRN